MNGGYCMINAAGVNLTAEAPATVTGLYNELYKCMSLNKPVQLYNVLTGENAGLYTPLGCACVLGDNLITIYTYVGKTFTVSTADEVTISA